MTTTSTTIVAMDAGERVRRFGIECIGSSGGDGIFFQAGKWRPGGEYIQKLHIKNVSTSVKKLKYRLPSTRYFSLEFPEVITLSPGMFKVIDVIFRPVEHLPYDDFIYIKMLDGIEGNGFHVPVRATIDKLILVTPSGLDFGYCPTHQTTVKIFFLDNVGEVDAPFQWDVPAPFILSPMSGIIAAGKSQEIMVKIVPTDASVFVSVAVCHVGAGVHAIIPDPIITTKLSAIGKYAYIVLSEDVVSFDEVISGTSPEHKEVILRNESVVPAEFSLIRLDQDRDEVFSITPQSGVIAPLAEMAVSVRYSPLAMGCYSLDRYHFRTPGNCSSMLTCRGMAMPPKVMLYKQPVVSAVEPPNNNTTTNTSTHNIFSQSSSNDLLMESMRANDGAPMFSLNFRDVEVGKVETRVLFLRNDSAREAAFSIIADSNGVFKMTPKQGIIPALFKSFAVTVVFSPTKPNNFYRRFFVLVGDALPLFYDCLGTGFIRAKGEVKEQRPAPIRHAHVQAYRNRSIHGLGGLSPDELDRMFDQHASTMSSSTASDAITPYYFAQTGRAGTRALSVTTLQRPVTRTGESTRPLLGPAHEFFIHHTDRSCREITVSKTQLDFGFAPHMSTSAAQTVTLYNRTHAKVVVDWQVPFAHGMQLADNVQLALGESDRDKDIITEDRAKKMVSMMQAFAVSPVSAEIQANQSASFQVTFVPKQSSRNFVSELEAFVYFKNQRTFRLVNDHSLTPPWCVTVGAVGHTFSSGQLLAKAILTGGNCKNGKLVFPCCFEGECTYQTFMLRNTSNLPSTFQIVLGWDEDGSGSSVDGEEVFSVKPTMGEVGAEDFVLICVRFAPVASTGSNKTNSYNSNSGSKSRKSVQLLRCRLNGQMSGSKLLLEGSGAVPFLLLPELQPFTRAELSWGLPSPTGTSNIPNGPCGQLFLRPTCVGLSTTRAIHIKNGSRLPLKFKLSLPERTDGLLISPMGGVLKGNESLTLTASFAPIKAEKYEYKLNFSVYPVGGRSKRVIDANQPGPVAAPELLQSFSVQLVAQGEVGALVFDPARLTVAVRLVNSVETKEIYLENVSESDVSYMLQYREEFTPDSASREVERTVSECMDLVSQPSFDNNKKREEDDEDRTSSNNNYSNGNGRRKQAPFEHSLFCESPSGVLPARSRTRIVLTYHPVKAGLFEFLLLAQVVCVPNSNKGSGLVSNDEAALLRLGQAARQDAAMSLTLLPLTASITARAAYPKLLIEDIRTDGPSEQLQIADVDALWTRFSIPLINYDLAIPMTAEEVRLLKSSSPDLSQLTTYKFKFCPSILNNSTQTVLLKIRNNGFLTSSFSMHFPNQKYLDLEAWCDEEEPTEELNRLISIIEELKVFSIEPTKGVLEPGESITLTLTYTHNSLKYGGLHNLPIIVKLDNGKSFYLDLQGHTLPGRQPSMNSNSTAMMSKKRSAAAVGATSSASIASAGGNSQRLQTASMTATNNASNGSIANAAANISDILLVVCADGENTVYLRPVPLGLSEEKAPRQRTELINVSSVPLNYEVDLASIEELVAVNFHLPLLRLANPTGFIPAGGSVYLEWYFYPIEARDYRITVCIKYYATVSHQLPISFHNNNNSSQSIATAQPPPSRLASQQSSHGMSSSSVLSRKSSHGAMSRGNARTSIPVPQFNGTVIPTASQSLNFFLLLPGFDPRLPRPEPVGAGFDGGLPPIVPILQLANQQITLSQDLLDFGTTPTLSTVRRVLMLRNMSPTSVYEFIVDESSCVLCLDGLLSVQPSYGRISPNSFAYVDLVFSAKTQPLAFCERVKIMVRELLRASNKSRAGQRLLDKIKKKPPPTEHASIVARTTSARSHMMESLHLPEGRTASIPVTMSENGTVVSASTFSPTKPQQETATASMTQLNSFARIVEGEESTFDHMDTATRARSSAVGFVNNKSTSSTPLMSKTAPTFGNNLNDTFSRGGGGMGSPGARSSSSPTDFSRPPLSRQDSNMSRSETGKSTIASGQPDGYSLFGASSILIVRIKGEVYDAPTAEALLRVHTKDPNPLNAFVVSPVHPVFVPPVGHTPNTNPNKARVNISFIKDRDVELRCITEAVIGSIFRAVLAHSDSSHYLIETISGRNNRNAENNAISFPLSPLSTKNYGVYMSEIRAKRSLQQSMMVELKLAGYRSLDRRESDNSDTLKQSNPHLPLPWTAAGEAALLTDELTYSLTLKDARNALIALFGISSYSDEFKEIDARMISLAEPIADKLAFDSVRNEIIAENNSVVISTAFNSTGFQASTAQLLERQVNKTRDERHLVKKKQAFGTHTTSMSTNSTASNAATTQKSSISIDVNEDVLDGTKEKPNYAGTALKTDGALELLSECMNELMFHVVQDSHAISNQIAVEN